MRIDLPCCGFKNCRFQFDGNCTSTGKYEKCEYRYLSEQINPERKKGKWILDENPHDGDCRCSVCLMAIDQMHERNHGLLNALTGGKWWTFYNFCPNCGADMRGEQDELKK